MPYTFSFKRKDHYLHVNVSGDNCFLTVKRYLTDVLEACLHTKCPNVLIEENLKGPRLETLDVFKIIEGGDKDAAGYMQLIAYVDSNPESGPGLIHFAEALATKLGFKIRAFYSVQEAERWIESELASASEA